MLVNGSIDIGVAIKLHGFNSTVVTSERAFDAVDEAVGSTKVHIIEKNRKLYDV